MTQKKFKEIIYTFYKEHKRDLPWRKTRDPYRIWVSEIMLQQTQVDRVIPKYKTFIQKFPTIEALASARLKDVLIAWQGLGYNRRAKLLHEGAKYIQKEHKGTFPKVHIEKIPGIGPYTAGAIQAFAFNKGVPVIETNIRTAYTHHFFKGKEQVSDKEILVLVEKTLDTENPREWYWALMDYGSHLKRQGIRINAQSRHYTKQKPFKGSDREVRGAILRELSQGNSIQNIFPDRKNQKEEQIRKLLKDGLIIKRGRGYALPG